MAHVSREPSPSLSLIPPHADLQNPAANRAAEPANCAHRHTKRQARPTQPLPFTAPHLFICLPIKTTPEKVKRQLNWEL